MNAGSAGACADSSDNSSGHGKAPPSRNVLDVRRPSSVQASAAHGIAQAAATRTVVPAAAIARPHIAPRGAAADTVSKIAFAKAVPKKATAAAPAAAPAAAVARPRIAPKGAAAHVVSKKAAADAVSKKAAADAINREFENVVCQDMLWEPLCHKQFHVTSENVNGYWPKGQMSWRECYQKLSESAFILMLEVSKGPYYGTTQIVRRIQDELTIGRSRRNHVCLLLDEVVSRKHARIRYHNRCFWIQDIGSSNGTWVRNQCLPQFVDVHLHPGDVVEVGLNSFTVSLHFDDAPNKSSTVPKSAAAGLVPKKAVAKAVLPCELVCAALWMYARRCLQQPQRLLKPPRYMQREFQPRDMQRFLRSCVFAAAHGLVAPTASVRVSSKVRWRLRNSIFEHVMRGFVRRVQVRQRMAGCAVCDVMACRVLE